MEQKTDFLKCIHYDNPNCPGQYHDPYGHAIKTTIFDIDGKDFTRTEQVDFMKEHGCVECKEYKKLNPSQSNHDV